MIVNKNNIETDCFLDVNNDIYRLITLFNSDESLKRFLVYTDRRPLEDYDVVNRKSLEEYGVTSIADLDLRDKQICRVPVLPANEEDGSLVGITELENEEDDTATSIDEIEIKDVKKEEEAIDLIENEEEQDEEELEDINELEIDEEIGGEE